MPPGARVTITARIGDTVRLLVTDDGPGIDPAVLAVRERSAAGTGATGGLGLPLAARLVRADGGDLVIATNGGSPGTTIVIELPRGARAVQAG